MTNQETSGYPATIVHLQIDTLTIPVFVLNTLNTFCPWLMLAWEPATYDIVERHKSVSYTKLNLSARM